MQRGRDYVFHGSLVVFVGGSLYFKVKIYIWMETKIDSHSAQNLEHTQNSQTLPNQHWKAHDTHQNTLGLFPNYIEVGNFYLSSTLITSFVATALFLIFLAIYRSLKAKNPLNGFVNFVDWLFEWIIKFFDDVTDWLPNYAKALVLFIFVYLLWNNLVGLVWDLFAGVVPALHHIFRPVATDIMFNAILAITGVLLAIFYGFQRHGLGYINKYFPIFKGIGIVQNPKWIKGWILKLLDILLGLFVGILEMISEIAKILSLSLRLFGNIFAWVVLVWLIIAAAGAFWGLIFKGYNPPLLFPLLVVVMELFVGIVQAFVFAMLVASYFKVAESHH